MRTCRIALGAALAVLCAVGWVQAAGATPPDGDAPAYRFRAADPGVEASTVLLRPGRAPKRLTAVQAAALPAPKVCGGYRTLASSGAYSTRGNVCLFESTGSFDVGAVARFLCYKNGVSYGAGLGGCRWVWNQVMQRTNDGVHWQTMTSNDNCYTCEGIFVDDSGRWYGNQTYALWCGYTLRGATRSTAATSYRVRFYKTDGSEALVNMAVNLSGHLLVPCTQGKRATLRPPSTERLWGGRGSVLGA